MLALFQRLARPRAIGILFLLYVLFPAVVLPTAEARIKAYSGGVGVIDLKFGYTPDEAFGMVAAYGEEGRAFYRLVELTVDVLYPLSYTFFFSALLTVVLRRAFSSNPAMQRLALIPAVTFLFDMAENGGIVTMLSQYPAQSILVAQTSNVFTMAKWVAFGGIIMTLFVGLGMIVVRRFARHPARRIA